MEYAVDDESGIDEHALAHVSFKLNSVKHLFCMLSAIYNGKKDLYCTIAANSQGEDAPVSCYRTVAVKQWHPLCNYCSVCSTMLLRFTRQR